MRKLRVNLGEKSYDIIIEKGIIEKAGQYIKSKKVFVITDENVDPLYGEKFFSSIGGEVKKLVLPPGEDTKSFKILQKVYDFLLQNQISRSDTIVALGGGVIGDLTGFAAATVLRGVPFVQIPTSLLAQVDSSVGGKVAINSPYGKNLIGAFYQPKLVLIDPLCLETLDKRYIADGMAEVIKYGCIRDENLFSQISKSSAMSKIEDVIYTCCDIKRSVVENDEFDTGERMILNFGHTIGHAVENYYNYEKYTHGEAVAIGMYNISLIGEKMGITPEGTAEKIKEVLQKYNLPHALDVDFASLSKAMALDKKNLDSNIHLILLDRIGNAVIRLMPGNEVLL
ncbi:MAG: 3-dehydroquinate synthase [Eubacteriales bacterium]|jgi:3-dehydroquinate synthase|nr:3-dehydroquinate synthase [Eubacteriales bacterium]